MGLKSEQLAVCLPAHSPQVSAGWGTTFVQGIFANWLVCLAVWMAKAAQVGAAVCAARFNAEAGGLEREGQQRVMRLGVRQGMQQRGGRRGSSRGGRQGRQGQQWIEQQGVQQVQRRLGCGRGTRIITGLTKGTRGDFGSITPA